MNLIPVLARAFGVDPTRFEAQVAAYESPGIILPPADRLDLIERRHREAGGGDADKAWLIAEVKMLRTETQTALIHHDKGDIEDVAAVLDEALNSGRGVYQP